MGKLTGPQRAYLGLLAKSGERITWYHYRPAKAIGGDREAK